MARIAEVMTKKRLDSLTKTVGCGQVPGLYVNVKPLKDGEYAKYFVLRVRSMNRVFTLGKYPDMDIAEAVAKAVEWKKKIAMNIDPAKEEKDRKEAEEAAKRAAAENEVFTFEKLMREWIRFNEKRGRWHNTLKTKGQLWNGYFKNHIPEDLRRCPVVDLTAKMFHDALAEKWSTMVDTPERILSDARQAIDWAIRTELIPPMINPAKVKDGRLGDLLPLTRVKGSHEPALPPERMPEFFKELMRLVPSSQTARCLAFAILTSARNSAAREATWEEIQEEKSGQWLHVIPRARMKVKGDKIPFDRKTPLSAQALALLKTAPTTGAELKGLIFPNVNKDYSPVSREAFCALLKRMHDRQRKIDGVGWIDPDQFHLKTGLPRIVTMHGLARATFNTWAKDGKRYGHPFFPKDVRESCLDHRNESYKCAYDRDQAIGEMREVYDAWGEFCFSLIEMHKPKTTKTRGRKPKSAKKSEKGE